MKSIENLVSAKEDVFYFHKVLGFSCLMSYATRFSKAGERDMGFDDSVSTLLTILLHLLLSTSSLLFYIPQRRMNGSAFRIWPEYRLHSIIFACRSLALMSLIYLFTFYEIPEGPLTHASVAMVVILTCTAADRGSKAIDKASRSHTIRDLGTHPAIRFLFSVFQIYATAGCLYELRRYSCHFVILFIIQFNAFLMTLQRKNVASHNVGVALYAAMLVLGFSVNSYEVIRTGQPIRYFMPCSFANIAAILRLGVNLNKYVLWAVAAVLMHYARAMEDSLGWLYVYLITMAILVLLGFNKICWRHDYDDAKQQTTTALESDKKDF